MLPTVTAAGSPAGDTAAASLPSFPAATTKTPSPPSREPPCRWRRTAARRRSWRPLFSRRPDVAIGDQSNAEARRCSSPSLRRPGSARGGAWRTWRRRSSRRRPCRRCACRVRSGRPPRRRIRRSSNERRVPGAEICVRDANAACPARRRVRLVRTDTREVRTCRPDAMEERASGRARAVEVPLRRGERILRVRARRRRPSARRRRRRGGVRKHFRVLLDDLNLRRVRAMKRAFLRRRQTDERRGSKSGRVRAKPRRDGKRCTLGETRLRGANLFGIVLVRRIVRRLGCARLHLARYLAKRLRGDVLEKTNDVRARLIAFGFATVAGGRRRRRSPGFARDTPNPRGAYRDPNQTAAEKRIFRASTGKRIG